MVAVGRRSGPAPAPTVCDHLAIRYRERAYAHHCKAEGIERSNAPGSAARPACPVTSPSSVPATPFRFRRDCIAVGDSTACFPARCVGRRPSPKRTGLVQLFPRSAATSACCLSSCQTQRGGADATSRETPSCRTTVTGSSLELSMIRIVSKHDHVLRRFVWAPSQRRMISSAGMSWPPSCTRFLTRLMLMSYASVPMNTACTA